ncbi:unnamed protein product [Parascedosporium putredinis]|uniref:SMP-30/Gluconolactonase/LRE-like region domain-containing protein n=1 Tax=Parascedosporium putredinis TaxID=1442378 RepID=A0A9P1GYB8_9PEZI|nr:unnamed protein product [Parascedosporium putredinis]CAI7991594.1 unnamed protein product [Parascedosporium putredinis]
MLRRVVREHLGAGKRPPRGDAPRRARAVDDGPADAQSRKDRLRSGALGLTGVTEIRHDVFGFAAGNFNTTDFTVEAGSWSVWTVDLTGEEPVTELLADVPEAGFLLGTATYGTNSMLVADAAEGKVYKFDAETGAYEVIIEDDLLKPAADAQIPEAIHSIRNFGEELYFTNTFGNAFGHFFLNAVTAEVGEVNIVTNLTSPLDFIIDGNGTSYVGQIGDGIVKVTQDGTVTPMWNITSATSLAFGRRKAEFDIIYAGTAVGELYALQIDW